jgi:competence protein ComGC
MLKFFHFKQYAGFTLLETMIVIFFLVLLMSVFFSLFIWHNSIYHYQESFVKVSEQGRNTLAAIQQNVNQAYRVLATSSVSGTLYTSSATTTVLQLPAIDSANSVISGKWDYVVFSLSGQNLSEIVQPDASSARQTIKKQLSDSAQSLSFTYNNNTFSQVTEVSVNFNPQINYKGHLVGNNLQQNIYLHNYY